MGIFEKLESLEDFNKRMDIVYNYGSNYVKAYPINIFLLTSKEKVTIFEDVHKFDLKFNAEIKEIQNNLFLLNYSRTWGDSTFSDYAYIFTNEKGWIVVIDNYNTSPLEGLIKRLYPKVSPSYQSSDDMYCLMNWIIEKERNNDEFIADIYYMTAKKPGEQTESIFKNVTMKQMKEKIERSFLIDKIKLMLKQKDRVVFNGLISREGFCSFYNGDFSYFNKIIANYILESGMKKLDFCSDLIKNVHNEIISQPIELHYEEELTPNSLKQLSKDIQKIDNLSLSVIHEGNPMLLVHAIDIVDGSTFNITAIGKSIFLTPVLDTSGASLLKTGEHIARSFQEPIKWSYYGRDGNWENK
ncbi:MAG: hypothetical protein IMZ58_06770 [Thermoplasmata archaeon]|nr:hypothetical protein [Thermoplasmata archaeon]